MIEKIKIIAEAGVNHNGKLDYAYKLIDIASKCNADLVKFQITNSELITDKAVKAKYQINKIKNESQREMVKKLEMDWDHVNPILIRYSKKKKIDFLTTAFDINALEHLKKLNFKIFKVPSGEIINHPYLKKLASYKAKIIMSTGMANMKEIAEAVSILTNNGTRLKDITLMQCNTAYPTPYVDVNLRAMETLKNNFGTNIGYSDHTLGIEASIAAAALGAKVIEKHFTISTNLKGPDHKSSLSPKMLDNLVRSIRNVEKSLGNGIKIPTKSESINIKVARQSIVAKVDIGKNENFTINNIMCKRAGIGLSPSKFDILLKKKAKKVFKKDDLIVI